MVVAKRRNDLLKNGNDKMDSIEAGLANWTVNLKRPPGKLISEGVTNNDGRYGFLLPEARRVR